MFELKAISKDGLDAALARAEHYRLLNEPRDAESICRDILRVESDHQPALITLVLSLTDQFGRGLRVNARHALELLPRIKDEYARTYYGGVIYERWAKAQHAQDVPGNVVFDWLAKAMAHYEAAEALSPADSDDAILRWNACARIIRRNDSICPNPDELDQHEALMQDDVPVQ